MARPQQIADDQLLHVAREVFLEHGPNVSTTLIAERAGVSQATLFKRFGNKSRLMLAALMPSGRPPFLGLLQAGPTDAPLEVQLTALLHEMLRFFHQMVPCMATLRASEVNVHELMSQLDVPPPVAAQQAWAGWLSRGVARGLVRPCEVHTVATAILGAAQTRAFLNHLVGGALPGAGDDDAYVAGLVELLVSGLAPKESR